MAARPRRLRSLVHAAFIAYVVTACMAFPGWDLTASYVAGRLAGTGQIQAIYDLRNAPDGVMPPAWQQAARQGGITDGVVTPYVQTPLWAWVVAPLATLLPFAVYKAVFAGLLAAATLVVLAAATRQWAPGLAGTGAQAMLLAALVLSVPFSQTLVLSQPHILFVCLAVLAAQASLGGRQVLAGGLLALATWVTITPGWLALTWLVAGRWRAVASFAAASCGLAAATLLVSGAGLVVAYIDILQAFSRHVLLSFNNESLATVLLARQLSPATAFDFAMVAQPVWARLLGVALTAGAAALGGLLDRRAAPADQRGAVLVLVAATAFAPLAWNHYFVILLLPALIFLQAWRDGRGLAWALLAVVVLALLCWPIAYTVGAPLAVVARRSAFWAAMLCLAGLVIRARHNKPLSPASELSQHLLRR